MVVERDRVADGRASDSGADSGRHGVADARCFRVADALPDRIADARCRRVAHAGHRPLTRRCQRRHEGERRLAGRQATPYGGVQPAAQRKDAPVTDQPDQPDRSGEPVPGGDTPDGPEAPEEPAHDGDAAGAAGTTEPVAEPTRTGGRWLIAAAAVVVCAGLVVTGWLSWQVYDNVQHDPGRSAVGDCLAGAGPDELRRVDCDDPAATWRVAARQPGLAWADFQQIPDEELCAGQPGTALAVWFGDEHDAGPGDVFCLEPVG
jgi:hypothetical protein